MSKHQYSNRLLKEKSHYLLQHAHNPVDWFPWGAEAFEKAREDDKPIFLSIGYATCHWCHVMAEEVFENEEVAERLNEAFVNVKVDREELPDVDALYMEIAQTMIAGAAGWPLNVVLTPDLYPIFAATYIPVTGKPGMMGMDEVISHIQNIWNGPHRERVTEQSEHIIRAQQDANMGVRTHLPRKDVIERTIDTLYKLTDPIWGGMQGSPKFPLSFQNELLLGWWDQTEDKRALFCVEKALDNMARGGIYDQIGGGFSRYSVDEMWCVPHFEKMLYDNALLARTYLQTWKVTRNERHRIVLEEILAFVLREMTGREGGFFSAQDADSEGIEGKFYTWTPEEIVEVLGKADGMLCTEYFGVSAEGNLDGRSVLHLAIPAQEFAQKRGLDLAQLRQSVDQWRAKLFEAREMRVRPLKDDKVLTSWNGLMIGSFAQAGVALQNDDYVDCALRACKFIQGNLWDGERLYHRWRDGDRRYSASLDDYAFLISGLLSVYEATGITHWLEWAVQLTDIVARDFRTDGGAFFQTDGKDPHLLLRRVQYTDGAEPSGNGVHAENLLRLFSITWKENYRSQADGIFRGVAALIDNYPIGFCYHLSALQRRLDPNSRTVVVAFNQNEEFKRELMTAYHRRYHSHMSVIWRHLGDQPLAACAPHTKVYLPVNGQTTLYVCREGACEKPVTGLTNIIAAIQDL